MAASDTTDLGSRDLWIAVIVPKSQNLTSSKHPIGRSHEPEMPKEATRRDTQISASSRRTMKARTAKDHADRTGTMVQEVGLDILLVLGGDRVCKW
jgi:hypothetical protein